MNTTTTQNTNINSLELDLPCQHKNKVSVLIFIVLKFLYIYVKSIILLFIIQYASIVFYILFFGNQFYFEIANVLYSLGMHYMQTAQTIQRWLPNENNAIEITGGLTGSLC